MAETDNVQDTEKVFDAAIATSYNAMNDEQRDMLSKVLFPETHTDKVVVAGKERQLHVLTMKWSKKVQAACKPLVEKINSVQKANAEDQVFPLDEEMANALVGTIKILCDAYGTSWDDVRVAVSGEDGPDLTIDEMQAVVVTQEGLHTKNDFFLSGLRLVIDLMRRAEIMGTLGDQVRLSQMSNIGPLPVSDSSAVSTS